VTLLATLTLATMNEEECTHVYLESNVSMHGWAIGNRATNLDYLFINFLPIIIFVLLHFAYPTKTSVTAISKTAPWHLQEKPWAIRRKKIKRYKIPHDKLSG
jgi:hypothetical protein